jgi:hypothetical protein
VTFIIKSLCPALPVPRHHPSREMLQTRERQIRQDQPVGAQFLEEADLLELLGKAFGSLARRHGTKPFAPTDPAVLDRRQKAWHPALPVGRQDRRDQLEQGLLVMPPRGDHEAPDVALTEQQVMMLDQPRTGARHELGRSKTAAASRRR